MVDSPHRSDTEPEPPGLDTLMLVELVAQFEPVFGLTVRAREMVPVNSFTL
jgi:hypothetical protein